MAPKQKIKLKTKGFICQKDKYTLRKSDLVPQLKNIFRKLDFK